ncbi:hypothetical protein [Paraburkholderia atlantica]|uniref:Uncharacterized protein n=1 Tax=Paraburkholderia atlantica TaxID=2654982 RepID=D5WDE2_PARAM|nr:hypothetical protein [Paraburkholderia atlantica]ADG18745.1 hypothetical protein BC1002_4780 [Paraburkholderia atlantica]MBB5504980.1 hippurate hydrolase [Paraburkholderia atlantica]
MSKLIETMSSAIGALREALAVKKLNEIPSNHSPNFAPVLDPALRTGLEAILCPAGASLDQHETTQ